ncbi:hypothetical protein [Gloeobacter morelensis]|uniref:Uncharacterized protein n=1 Tax=Gloeobacter morelensis MG652769 TaxID=2781736 RepID=A0ABY3PPQ6_9CYAN|nr:hypothetical protein [Gloeobacter morelensis]UFP95693.1 hypothetical protein ISF26_05500 [Gloeobacter morelensis MG652769]
MPRFNRAKSDALPTRALLVKRRECIYEYWRIYQQCLPQRFAHQIARALGCDPACGNWQGQAFSGLQENIERLATTRGLERWEP